MGRKTYDFPSMTALLQSMSSAQLRTARDKASKMASDLGTAGSLKYLRAVEDAIAARQHEADVAATPSAVGISKEDVERLWQGIEFTERVLTELNEVGKSTGRRKPARLNRTRQVIQRKGARSFLADDYSAQERNGQMQPAWYRNIWAPLSQGRPELLVEAWTIENAARFSGSKVGTAHDIIMAAWPLFGLEVPPRPAHAAPPNLKAIARMRRRLTEEMVHLSVAKHIALPETPEFQMERLAFEQERVAAIKAAGGRCQHPGCDISDWRMLHVHHVVHRAKGGSDHRDNLRVLCANHHALEHRD